ncbi:MAG: DNA gyrase subunit A, partial [Tenericutes bacterium HGW-Tenericutes-8]
MSKKTIDQKIDAFIEEKITSERLEDIIGERFGRYSKYIIQDRALPDARDGLKPVQRRILYAMYKMGMFNDKPFKKSARIAGEVMGKYHPHGDSSIYEAMVRMSQNFKMGVTLIDMHGNNGSIDGDSAAAMRYTEARLSKEAEYLIADIDKRTVPFIPNFDDEELEPTVLPAKFPNLLVNGANGISAGYATKIPPHNLKEIIKATIERIDKPDMTIDRLLKIVTGPDFPTGGIVQGKEGIRQAFETGSGKVIVRSRTFFETFNKDQTRIVVTEIPFEVNKSELVKSIDMLRIDKKLEDLQEVRDESDREGMRISIELKKEANPDICLAYLFKNTDLQVNYNYNMVAIHHQRPVQMGVIEILDAYINHQKEVITNRSNYDLDKAERRSHIVSGLIKMVDVIDEVVHIIRHSKNKQNSKDNIIKQFGFTELQAEAIVMLQLYRLSSTDIDALIKESNELDERIIWLKKVLSDEQMLLSVIKKEL